MPEGTPDDRTCIARAKELWAGCFGEELLDELKPQLDGAEPTFNEDTVYLGFVDGMLAATCHLTRSRAIGWAGLGEVATAAEFRGRGFAHEICRAALDDFDRTGGEAIWLGTVNPAAASVYASLGFGYLPDTSVMQRLRPDLSPTAFARRWIDADGLRIVPGSAAFRIPMIPLLTSKMGIETLDANVGLVGTEFRPQHSCMGLYPKYDALAGKGGGWAALVNGRGAVLGLASWLADADGTRRIGGFCHPSAADWRERLMEAVAK